MGPPSRESSDVYNATFIYCIVIEIISIPFHHDNCWHVSACIHCNALLWTVLNICLKSAVQGGFRFPSRVPLDVLNLCTPSQFYEEREGQDDLEYHWHSG